MPARKRHLSGLIGAALIIGLLPAGCAPPTHVAGETDYSPNTLRQEILSVYDFSRFREIPLRAYIPTVGTAPFPVIVFSPGIGTSRDHYASLGRYWAGHGYVAIFLSHPGADDAAIYDPHSTAFAILLAVRDYAQQLNARTDHPRDVSFVLDQLGQSPVLQPVTDPDRIAVAGHSFGAFTALALIGMRVDTLAGPDQDLRDPRIKVAIALSPPGPGVLGLSGDAFATLAAPCLSMMGTVDADPETTDPLLRRAAFEQATAPDQYLATLQGATHGVFDEQSPWTLDQVEFAQHHQSIELITTAFLDTYLRGDAPAQQWLLSRQIETQTDGDCTLEYRAVTTIGP